MTEKRFRLGAIFDGFQDIFDNESVIGCERTIYARKMVALLNKLHEQNKQLKRENDILITQRFGEERLKQEIADYHESNGRLRRLNTDLIRRLDKFHINYLDILDKHR